GRPMLADSQVDLKFSLSHSGDLVAVALSSELVGIDVEKAGTDPESVACCLSPEERARLRALPAQRRQSEFLGLWTTKEAYSKVLGQGMNRELAEITLDEIARGTHAMQFCLEARGRYQLTLLTARSGTAIPAYQTHFLSAGSLSLVGAVSAKIPWKPTPSTGARQECLRSFVS
ncbi:MAG: 4'-phosphopantetheinyl transferase family protein, partial [Bdellovibrionota bacterium]